MDRPWIDPLLFVPSYLAVGGALFAFCLMRRSAGRLDRVVRALLGLLAGAGAVFAGAAAAAGQPAILWQTPVVLLALYLPLFFLPSSVCGRLASVTVGACRLTTETRPVRIGLAALTSLGLPALGCALLLWHYDAQLIIVEPTNFLSLLDVQLEMRKVDYPLATDRGYRIQAMTCDGQDQAIPTLRAQQEEQLQFRRLDGVVIALEHGWQNCNCHGYVFTGGRFWVHGGQVPRILEDNGYAPISVPMAGDLAVYRNSLGVVVHTGVVRGLADDGVILVESKWGNIGRFLHPHDRHIYTEVESCTFYRSPRDGHLLHGLNPSDTTEPIPALLDEANATSSPLDS